MEQKKAQYNLVIQKQLRVWLYNQECQSIFSKQVKMFYQKKVYLKMVLQLKDWNIHH